MLDILAITAPIYLLISIGWICTRQGVFARADMRTFGKFVITLALPALVFRALSQRAIGEILDLGYLAAYLAGTAVVITLGYLGMRRLAGAQATAAAFQAMGMSCSNSGFVGYPILLLTLPAVAPLALALNMALENLIVIPVLMLMAERGRAQQGSLREWMVILKRLALNPIILGVVAGLLGSLLQLKLPVPVVRTIDMLAVACAAPALLVIGGNLAGQSLRGQAGRVLPIVLGKLVLHPLCVAGALWALASLGGPAVPPTLQVAALLLAAMPMMGIYPTLAQAYGHEDFSSVAAVVTTLASFFTLSGLLWLLKTLGALP